MKYRENMTPAEYAEMLKEILKQDEAYALADKMQAEFNKQFPPDADAVDEMEELRKAALNHKGEP